jgi:hypothetical protein
MAIGVGNGKLIKLSQTKPDQIKKVRSHQSGTGHLKVIIMNLIMKDFVPYFHSHSIHQEEF